jgi:hypothetical protein
MLKTPSKVKPEEKVPAQFIYKDERYAHITPAKRLMQSTMVYEVILRGDLFAVNVDTQVFTIIPRGEIYHVALV